MEVKLCDYSLHSVHSRPAVKDESLVTHNFGTGTSGFCGYGADTHTAVCVLPGTELAFDETIKRTGKGFSFMGSKDTEHKVARFRQVNREQKHTHHDALELPDGQLLMLTELKEGQVCKILQLPAAPKTEAEVEEQKRVEFV